MTPSGPNNQSILLRIALTSLHIKEEFKTKDLKEKYADNAKAHWRSGSFATSICSDLLGF
jgi:hypothetical protein